MFQGTSTPVQDDTSSAAVLVQSRSTVTQPQESGQPMVPDASAGCTPAQIHHDAADSDWRDNFFGGVFQPPVRRAAAKAMIRMDSQRCSPSEPVQVAAAVDRDGRQWVDDRSTNTSNKGGGGCDGGSVSGGVQEVPRGVKPFNNPPRGPGKGLAEHTREIIGRWCWVLLLLRNIGVAQTTCHCLMPRNASSRINTPTPFPKSASATTQSICLKRHTRDVLGPSDCHLAMVFAVILSARAFVVILVAMMRSVDEFGIRSMRCQCYISSRDMGNVLSIRYCEITATPPPLASGMPPVA